MDYDIRHMPIREIEAAEKAGYLTKEEARFAARSMLPQLDRLDSAKRIVEGASK